MAEQLPPTAYEQALARVAAELQAAAANRQAPEASLKAA
jgi:hypothetical protein